VEVTKLPKPPVQRVAAGDLANRRAVTCVNAEQASKVSMREPSRLRTVKAVTVRGLSDYPPSPFRRRIGDSTPGQIAHATREAPLGGRWYDQPEAREGQAGPGGVAEGSVVPRKPGNAGGGKGPWLKAAQHVARDGRLAMSLATPKQVQKPQTALHDKRVTSSPRAGCGKSARPVR
jgi:hypothetical protein